MHFSSFALLHTKITPQSASCAPLAFYVVAQTWLFLRLHLLHTFFASLIVLFWPFSVVLCLLVYRVFFACQFSRNYPRHFPWGGHSFIVYLPFSHYESPFPTRDCIPYVRSGLYRLVIRVKGIRVCALHCVREVTSFSHCFRSFVLFGVDTTFQRAEFVYRYRRDHVGCFCCRDIVKLFVLLLIRSLFVNKDLCTSKSVKRTIK